MDDETADPWLAALEYAGSGTLVAGQILALVGHSQFFTDFDKEDITLMAGYMEVYRARAGDIIIREADSGDFMLLLIEGTVDIVKQDPRGVQQTLTQVVPGMIIGEMSMIDGEPRFATCIAAESVVFAVLTRHNMVRIIMQRPTLAAKILIKLVSMLSQRLRQTSNRLLQYRQV